MTQEDKIEEEVKAVAEPTQETVEELETTYEYLSMDNPLTGDRFRAKCRELNGGCPNVVVYEGFHATIKLPTIMTQTTFVSRTTNATPSPTRFTPGPPRFNHCYIIRQPSHDGSACEKEGCTAVGSMNGFLRRKKHH